MRELIPIACSVLVVACATAHGAEMDGATLDASTTRDSGDLPDRIDAFVCPDEDRDGDPRFACGGRDCDDGRPDLYGDRPACGDGVTQLQCSGADVVEVVCGADAAYCDARTGLCAASACGDGVLHEGERCDDGNEVDGDGCSATCDLEPCGADEDCPSYAPSCSDLRGDAFYCRAPIEGGRAIGEPCESDDECRSGWCDAQQARCSRGCTEEDDCPAFESVCTAGDRAPPLLMDGLPPHCAHVCYVPADCPEGSGCRLRWFFGHPWTLGRCVPATGTIPNGGECGSEESCETAMCLSRWGYPDVTGQRRCSHPCREASDCELPELPNCVEYGARYGMGIPLRPEGWAHRPTTFCALD